MKETIKYKLKILLQQDNFEEPDWKLRGLNISSNEICLNLNSDFRKCIEVALNILENDKPEILKKKLSYQIRKIKTFQYDTEELGFLADQLFDLATLLQINISPELNKWRYGFLLGTLLNFSIKREEKRNILPLFFLFATLTTVAQTHNFQPYSLEEGLPQSQIYAAIEDSKGYLWLGTQGGGLSRFDGKNFTNFGVRQGLADNIIFSLFEDSRGQIWIGTNNGISVFSNGTIQSFQPKNIRVNCFFEKENQLLAGTSEGIFVFRDSIFEPFSPDESLSKKAIYSFAENEEDEFLIGGNRGLFELSGKRAIPFFDRRLGEIRDIGFLDSNTKIIATYGNGTWLATPDSLINLNERYQFPGKIIHDILVVSEEEIWFATQRAGAIRFNLKTGKSTVLNDQNGLPTNHTRRIIKDRWGNIWIATSAGGLVRYLGEQFVHFDRKNGLKGDLVYAVLERKNGELWFAEGNKGIARMDSSGITHFGRDSGFLNVKCKALFEDSSRRLLIGTEGGGLGLFAGNKFRIFTTKNGLPSNYVRDIAEDSEGLIWLATSDGSTPIYFRDSIVTQQDSVGDSLFVKRIIHKKIVAQKRVRTGNTIMLHHDGKRIWFGSKTGRIGHINPTDRAITYLDKKLSAAVTSMREDSTGYLWISSQGAGISFVNLNEDSLTLQSLKFTDLSAGAEGDLPQNIYLLNLDRKNNLWAGTNRGVDKITLNESRQPISIKSFGKSDGFSGIETCRNAAICDQNGQLWFGTVSGLTKYTPGSLEPEQIKPTLFFTDVNLNYKSLIISEFSGFLDNDFNLKNGLELPYNKNRLGFEYAAIHLGQAEKIRYQTKLTNYDSEWSPPTVQQQIYYPNLQPGEYQFDVRACVEGTNNCSIMTTPIWTIRPPFWQTWWFRLSVFLGTTGIITLIFRSRLKAERRRAKATEDRLEMQNKMLRLEQQALQLQMNPHFIFNALNSIQSLVVSGDSANARLQLNKFAGLMRGILNNSRAERITLEEEISTLRKYLDLERLNRNEHFDFEINLPENIPADDLEIPPMLIQPFTENAVIHGVSHLPKGEGKITVDFEFDEEVLTCSVTDNGIGRKAAAAKTTKPNHRSVAMQVTRERLEFLAKSKTDLEVFEIEDLEQGTRVVLRIII